MLENPPSFTPEEKEFLAGIRNDITDHPEFYKEGINYLQKSFSPEEYIMDQYKEYNYKPKKESIFLCNCLSWGFGVLLNEGLGTPDDDLNPYDITKVKAVLCLTWLLTDKEANRKAIGAAYGVWGDDFSQQVELKGRCMARCSTLDGSRYSVRKSWMNLAKIAWTIRQIQNIPTTDESSNIPIKELENCKINNARKKGIGVEVNMGSDQAATQTQTQAAGEEQTPKPLENQKEPLIKTRIKGRRHRQPPAKGLTSKQTQAVEFHGKCNGNYSEGARRMGVSTKTFRQHVHAGYKKLGLSILKPQKVALPTDPRHGINIAVGQQPEPVGNGKANAQYDRRLD